MKPNISNSEISPLVLRSISKWERSAKDDHKRIVAARSAFRIFGVMLEDKTPEAQELVSSCLRCLISCFAACSINSNSDAGLTRSLLEARNQADESRQINSSNVFSYTLFASRSSMQATEASASLATRSVIDALNSLTARRGYKEHSVDAAQALVNEVNTEIGLEKTALLQRPIWNSGDLPSVFLEADRNAIEYFSNHLEQTFWHNWYIGVKDGAFQDWELAALVAKIPDDIWKDGLAAVAKAIREIEARLRTSVATPLERAADDSVFQLQIEANLSRETLDFIKERVGGALASALEAGGRGLSVARVCRAGQR